MVPPRSIALCRRCGGPTTSAASCGRSSAICRAAICRASRAAYEFSAKAHQGQQRRNGDPYISHPVAVAEILAGLHLDSGSIKAALLHDVVEDTANTLPEIQERFGEDVALARRRRQQDRSPEVRQRAEAQAESFRKMLLAMAKDLRVILVKLADRTHNMRTISSLPIEKQRRIARETLDIYAPIANRLGVYSIKLELEDLGFKTFYPFRYKVLERSLRRAKGNQRQLLRKIEGKLTEALADAKIPARVVAREKHLYSIYLKMQRKQAHLSDIVDVYGVRVIVDDVDQLLSRARHHASVVQADAGPVQGLHLDSARQRLPVVAHDAVRAERLAARSADSHRGHGEGRRARHRRALAIQGRRQGHAQHRRARARMARGAHGDGARGELRGVPRDRQGATCSPTRSTCSRRRARSCGCRAARRPSTSLTPCIRMSAIAASRPRSIGAPCR